MFINLLYHSLLPRSALGNVVNALTDAKGGKHMCGRAGQGWAALSGQGEGLLACTLSEQRRQSLHLGLHASRCALKPCFSGAARTATPS